MPRPGNGSIGHSKHRQAFGSKRGRPGYGLLRILREKDEKQRVDEEMKMRERQKGKMVRSIRELFHEQKDGQ